MACVWALSGCLHSLVYLLLNIGLAHGSHGRHSEYCIFIHLVAQFV